MWAYIKYILICFLNKHLLNDPLMCFLNKYLLGPLIWAHKIYTIYKKRAHPLFIIHPLQTPPSDFSSF